MTLTVKDATNFFIFLDLDGFKSQVDYHVKIPCFSSTTIENCLWYRNGIPTSISGRYLYVGDGDGHNTNDCSIQILNWFTLDVGKWTCAGKDGDEVLSITLPYLISRTFSLFRLV